jgi:hypothetical protein
MKNNVNNNVNNNMNNNMKVMETKGVLSNLLPKFQSNNENNANSITPSRVLKSLSFPPVISFHRSNIFSETTSNDFDKHNNSNNDKTTNKNDTSYPFFYDPRLGQDIPLGWRQEEHFCLLKLNINDEIFENPTLLNYRPLTSALMKAVTSTKISSTGRYALVGYGVRNNGVVEDHDHR